MATKRALTENSKACNKIYGGSERAHFNEDSVKGIQKIKNIFYYTYTCDEVLISF